MVLAFRLTFMFCSRYQWLSCAANFPQQLRSWSLQKRLCVSSCRPMAHIPHNEPRYQLPRLDNVEDIEKYKPGGFHPVHLGDTLRLGRYTIEHKLGFGGFSTVWLARDNILHRLVSVKILIADSTNTTSEPNTLRQLHQFVRNNVVIALDEFTLKGPNGEHKCIVSPLGGPSVASIIDSPGEVAGTRRLRASIARKAARQLAQAVAAIHDAGFVHGGMWRPPVPYILLTKE